MSFIQLIEYRTDKPDELFAVDKEWEAATEGKRTTRRVVVARDRDDADRHVIMVFFDSYESAMQNSELPETAEFAKKQTALLSAPPVFHNLDIIDDRS